MKRSPKSDPYKQNAITVSHPQPLIVFHRNYQNVEEEKRPDGESSEITAAGKTFYTNVNGFLTYLLDEEEFKTNWEEVVESFDDMGLKEGVLRGIYGHGFVKPSPIQQKGILPVI